MLNKLILFSIRNKLIVAVFTVTLVIWGIWSARQLPIDALPDITNNQVQIITSAPSLATQEVERLVSFPVEQSIATVPDVVEIRSISRFGLSLVTVVFEEHVDIYHARQLILENLRTAEEQIPPGIGKPELAPVSTGLGEVYQYIIHPKAGSEKKYSVTDLRTMQDWIVARQLYGTRGVVEVNSFGGKLKQYEVAVDPSRLRSRNVTMAELFAALENNNENTGGAYIDKKPTAWFIRSVGLITSLEDIGRIVIRHSEHGIPILVKDVAKVQFGHAVRYGALTYNGEMEAVGGVVMMLKGRNSAEVVDAVKARMETIRQSLPDDITIEPYLDRSDLISRTIRTVKNNLIEGALIVILVLVLFLGNLRAGLIVASAIPLSMLFALGMMHLFGISANLMSLGAIDFGLIVDGAVIIVEATMHHLGLRKTAHRLSQREMDNEVFISASNIRNSAAFGEIIILLVYIPILTLTGVEGKMFKPMAQTVSFAILGALILSVTYIPMMCAAFLPRVPGRKQTFSDRMIAYLQRLYLPLLKKAIRIRYLLIGAVLALFTVSLISFSRMGSEFIPQLGEGDFAFHCILPQGASLSQSVETSMQASRIIKGFDEVNMVVGKTGSAEVPTDPMPPEITDLMVILKPQREWASGRTYAELSAAIEEALSVIPGVFFEASQPIQMRFNELMTGIRQDVAVKIFGEDLDTLSLLAGRVSSLIRQVEGATEPAVERISGLPQITVTYDYARIATYGIPVKDLNRQLSTAFAGMTAGMVYENERRFDLVVRLGTAQRQSIEDVRELLVALPDGHQVPLSQLANIEFREGPAQISREDAKRRVVIGFNTSGRDVQSVVNDIQQQISENLQLPTGYYVTYGGQFENLQKARSRLLLAVPLALGLIFVLLFFTFGSVRQSLLIFTAIPMSAIGGIWALQLRGMPFSISAGVGFIALFGVAVLNGIVLISTYNQLRKEGYHRSLSRALRGAVTRLRPVLMTASVASLGFLPMALSAGAGAEVQKPLATVVIGGLISATLLTLFILPLLYLLIPAAPTKHSHTMKKHLLSIAFAVALCGGPVLAQSPPKQILTLEECLTMARKQHAGLQSHELTVKSSRALEKTAFDPGAATLNLAQSPVEGGGPDNSIGVFQSFRLPGVYHRQRRLLGEQTRLKQYQYAQEAGLVDKEVKSAYYRLLYLKNLLSLLEKQDSLLAEFREIAALRYRTGETSKAGELAANNEYRELQLQQQQTHSAYGQALLELQLLLHTDTEIIPAETTLTMLSGVWAADTAALARHPASLAATQQVAVSDARIRTAKAAFMPGITVGYLHQYLIPGFNPANIHRGYTTGTRTASVQLGLSFPVFSTAAEKARVSSAVLDKESAEAAERQTRRQLQTDYQQQYLHYRQLAASLGLYEKEGLPQARELSEIARQRYQAGETDYVEYLQNMEQALSVQQTYMGLLAQYNEAVIELEFLTGSTHTIK